MADAAVRTRAAPVPTTGCCRGSGRLAAAAAALIVTFFAVGIARAAPCSLEQHLLSHFPDNEKLGLWHVVHAQVLGSQGWPRPLHSHRPPTQPVLQLHPLTHGAEPAAASLCAARAEGALSLKLGARGGSLAAAALCADLLVKPARTASEALDLPAEDTAVALCALPVSLALSDTASLPAAFLPLPLPLPLPLLLLLPLP